MTLSWLVLLQISPNLLRLVGNSCRLILLSLAAGFLKTVLQHTLLYQLVVKITHKVLVILNICLQLPLHALFLLPCTKLFLATSFRLLNMDACRHRLSLERGLGLAFSVLDAWFYSVT